MKRWIKRNKKLNRHIKDVAEVAGYLWQRGWAERNAGNISVNLTGDLDEQFHDTGEHPFFNLERSYKVLAGGYFFVTGTGKRMRDLARKPLNNGCILKLTEEGDRYQIISQHNGNHCDFQPTSELPTHLAIQEKLLAEGSPNKAVVHTHPNELVAITQIKKFQDEQELNRVLWGMHPETMVFVPKGVALVPYIMPGTEYIAGATLNRLSHAEVIMWEKHGTFAVGQDAQDAFDKIDIMSKSARIFFMVKQAGFEPEGLSDKELSELKEKFYPSK